MNYISDCRHFGWNMGYIHIPHVDTGLKTHKYLVRYEDAEYYASHRDLKKEYEITPKQKPQKSRSKLHPLPDSELLSQYLWYKW